MNDQVTIKRPASALAIMAQRYQVDPTKLLETLKATAFKGASNEEMMALAIVANQYQLNPFLREIYAFPAKGGGIQPIVGIDGWLRLMNNHPQFDGIEYHDVIDAGEPVSCTATIYRKDRNKPTTVTEYYSENHRNTDAWNTKPCRMLRHRATIQCARVAFGFSGIADEDELPPAVIAVETEPQSAPRIRPLAGPKIDDDQVPGAEVGQGEPPTMTEAKPGPRQDLEVWLVSNDIAMRDFFEWGHASGNVSETATRIEDIDDKIAKRLMRDKTGMVAKINEFKAQTGAS